MEKFELQQSGIYIPRPIEADERAFRMVSSPMMQYLMLGVLNQWTIKEENSRDLWESQTHAKLAMVSEITMQGVTIVQNLRYIPQSKGWTTTSFMARGVMLARLSILSLAIGSHSDALSNYRMLLERERTIKLLEKKAEYDEFEKAYFAKLYYSAANGLSNEELGPYYSSTERQNSKEMMRLIRDKYFGGKTPKNPGDYWKTPQAKELTDEPKNPTVERLYDLGSRSVHPSPRDMIEPQESDIAADDLLGLVLTTLGELSRFTLSLFQETLHLVSMLEETILGDDLAKSHDQSKGDPTWLAEIIWDCRRRINDHPSRP